jgi:hypothetical protein
MHHGEIRKIRDARHGLENVEAGEIAGAPGDGVQEANDVVHCVDDNLVEVENALVHL